MVLFKASNCCFFFFSLWKMWLIAGMLLYLIWSTAYLLIWGKLAGLPPAAVSSTPSFLRDPSLYFLVHLVRAVIVSCHLLCLVLLSPKKSSIIFFFFMQPTTTTKKWTWLILLHWSGCGHLCLAVFSLEELEKGIFFFLEVQNIPVFARVSVVFDHCLAKFSVIYCQYAQNKLSYVFFAVT